LEAEVFVVVAAVLLLEPLVDGVDEPGVVVEVVVDDEVDVDDEEELGGVDELVLVGEATGVRGPGLTCSPAAATICQAMTVVNAVASTQIAMRAGRLMTEFSQSPPPSRSTEFQGFIKPSLSPGSHP
jgi:hypothetical protein